ncbi:MAG: hypothetical protein ABI442_01405 [Gemmatimonadaceae bacterium]
MSTVGDVFTFLQSIGETSAVAQASIANDVIRGAKPDDRAVTGDISWLSPKKADAAAERLERFRGVVLIYPAEATPGDGASPRGIPCRNPKLAFSRTVIEVLPGLTKTEWIAADSLPRDSDTLPRIAKGARLAPGVVISQDTVIENDVKIGPNTCIAHTTVKRGAKIGANCTIGQPGFGYERAPDDALVPFPHVGRVVIEEDVEIGNNTCIDRGSLGETLLAAAQRSTISCTSRTTSWSGNIHSSLLMR